MPRISQKFIDRKVQRPTHGQVIYRDNKLIGFGLRVTRGSLSYIVECRVNGINRRITIGRHGRLNPETARAEAQKLLSEITLGRNPIEDERRSQISKITLGEVLEDYIRCRVLRPNSIKNFRSIIGRCMADWVSIPITNITKDMVEMRHRELTRVTRQGTSGKAQANTAMERLSILFNFAINKYEIDGQPIFQKNPVDRLSQIRAWHRITPKQNAIPDHKLAHWYQVVISHKDKKIRDYLLLLLFTGLRRTEAATLKWSDIDLEGRILTIRAEIAKNHNEHRLPLTDFLHSLLAHRKKEAGQSEFVFSGRSAHGHMVDSKHAIRSIAMKCECNFTLHDLRRTFLTAAENLEVPHYAIKKLANHISRQDVTSVYVVVNAPRLRVYMERISAHFVKLLGVDYSDFT